MMNHKPINEWQEGLMKLFGRIDPLWWSVLWCLASRADENGHIRMTLHEISDAMVRYHLRLCRGKNSTLGRMKDAGLVRVARKRLCKYIRDEATGQVIPFEVYPQVLELYAGIKTGRVPAAGAVIQGQAANYWRQGNNVLGQTHKLIRTKFKDPHGIKARAKAREPERKMSPNSLANLKLGWEKLRGKP